MQMPKIIKGTSPTDNRETIHLITLLKLVSLEEYV